MASRSQWGGPPRLPDHHDGVILTSRLCRLMITNEGTFMLHKRRRSTSIDAESEHERMQTSQLDRLMSTHV
jgi:hypothetical protein